MSGGCLPDGVGKIYSPESAAREIAYFKELGRSFEWTTYEYDQPFDLEARLGAQGFEREETGALMALELATEDGLKNQAHPISS